MATKIIFYDREKDEIVEGELDGNEEDCLFVDYPASGSVCQKRYKVHYSEVIAEDGHLPGRQCKMKRPFVV